MSLEKYIHKALAILAVLSILVLSPTSHGDDLEKLARNITVKVIVQGKSIDAFGEIENQAFEGTGFLLTTDGYIVTNRHVVFPELIKYATTPDVSVYLSDQNGLIGSTPPVKATIVNNNDDDLDFLLLKIDGRFSVAECEYATPAIGDEVYIFGYGASLGKNFTSASGPIEASASIAGTTGKLASNIRSTYGNSGSPVFSVDSGKLIGFVLQSTRIPKETVFDLTIFHRLLQVRDFLPSSANCSFATSSCLSVVKRERHSKISATNGQKENCLGNSIVENNRAKVTVASLDGTQCVNQLSTAVVINAPQYPVGTALTAKVTTKFQGENYGFAWNYRAPDNNSLDKLHPTKEERKQLSESTEKVQVFIDTIRNGLLYEFDLVALTSSENGNQASAAEFDIEVTCN